MSNLFSFYIILRITLNGQTGIYLAAASFHIHSEELSTYLFRATGCPFRLRPLKLYFFIVYCSSPDVSRIASEIETFRLTLSLCLSTQVAYRKFHRIKHSTNVSQMSIDTDLDY
jgi:hypothetical protein